jgi:hypothetical protein
VRDRSGYPFDGGGFIVVNNYTANAYSATEVVINTTASGLEATGGRVYLTRNELLELIRLLDRETAFTTEDNAE